MRDECPTCKGWSWEKYIRSAQLEPERIKFWLPYSENYREACRSVCDNPPSFDKLWKQTFPNPALYCEMVRAQEAEERRATSGNITSPPCPHCGSDNTKVEDGYRCNDCNGRFNAPPRRA